MAYKVLGQVTTVAPASAPTINNLLFDSSFTGFTLPNAIASTSANSTRQISPLTPWRFQSSNTSSDNGLKSTTIDGTTTAPFGPTSSSYGIAPNTSVTVNLNQGWTIGRNSDTTPDGNSIDPATAITVVPGTTYQLGFSLYSSNGGGGSAGFKIAWFSSSLVYLSQSSVPLDATATASWHRRTSSVTSPSGAVWAILTVYLNTGSSQKMFVDGIVFGENSAYATTFTEPVLPSLASTTSPFDKKVNGFVSETVFSQTGVTFAGAFVTAYTVPAGKETVVSTLVISNISSSTTNYRVAVVPSGTSLAKEDLLFLDVPIAANSVQAITIGMTLAAGDIVRVAADNAFVNATLFGSES